MEIQLAEIESIKEFLMKLNNEHIGHICQLVVLRLTTKYG